MSAPSVGANFPVSGPCSRAVFDGQVAASYRGAMVVRAALIVLVASAPMACSKADGAPTATTERSASTQALSAPISVPFAQCPVTIPSDSEVVDASKGGFTVKVKGGRAMTDPSVLVVNGIVSIYDKSIEPSAENLRFTVDEKLPDDGYALEGDFDRQGRKYYFVDRSIPCAPKAWLSCRIITIHRKSAEYASRVCSNLVAPK